MKVIDQINGSAIFSQSAYSAAVATNDDLGRKISTTYLTAVDLSPYATTATTNTLSGQIEELSGTLSAQMSLSAGEGINFVEDAENHRTRIDLGLSAGSNMSFVYDQETNTIRLDAEGGDLSNYYTKTETSSKQELSAALANAGKTYIGVSPIVVNNTSNQISADTWSFSAGNGLVFTDDNANKVTKLEVEGESISAGPGINIFSSGGYVVISAEGGNSFPMTGTNGTTGFTANMDCSSMYLSTGAGPAGAIINFDTKGVHFEAYPSTDVSASWFNLITQYNNATCSSVKLTTAASENWFYTSALPNLNKITFIAPTYGPYETYSALIDDGSTTFVAEVDSGCCRTVVRCWNDDRNKDCWCGLNQETYFYIG